MYQAGDKVVYGIHGVCRVVDLEERTVDRKQVTYLALEPLGQDGARFFVPTHNAAAMAKLRRLLSREELEAMLSSREESIDNWIQNENLRKQTYRELINSGDSARLMRMVRTLYHHKAAQAAAGRKCHLCDESFLRDAEKLLTGEFCLVLGMEPEQVCRYIREKLKEEG